jgi:peptide/nickel transport system permease protein
MFLFAARRLGFSALTLLVVSFAVYVIFAILPFDPAALTCGQKCNDIVVEANRVRLGFDKPLLVQYWLFLQGIFLGRSYGVGQAAFVCPAPSLGYSFNENACVTDLLKSTLPITVTLALGALILWLIVGVTLGVLAAKFHGRTPDTASSVFVLLGTSLPTFVTGLVLLIWVSIKWKIVPLSFTGYVSFLDSPIGAIKYFILPWITLAIAYAALYTRFTRAAVLETMSEDYVRTARAKGLDERKILFKHTLRAVLAPITTLAGLDFAGLIGGAIITETIFNLPGLGRLTLRSVNEFDLSVVVATTILAAAVVIVMNLIVDMLYAVLDPRVRVQ